MPIRRPEDHQPCATDVAARAISQPSSHRQVRQTTALLACFLACSFTCMRYLQVASSPSCPPYLFVSVVRSPSLTIPGKPGESHEQVLKVRPDSRLGIWFVCIKVTASCMHASMQFGARATCSHIYQARQKQRRKHSSSQAVKNSLMTSTPPSKSTHKTEPKSPHP